MVAFVRESVVTPENQAAYRARSAEFAAVRAQQPGFQGALQLDAGAGRSLQLILWESPAAQRAAQPTLQPTLDRVQALWATPGLLLATGEVLRDTIAAGAAPKFARLGESTWQSGQWVAGQAQVNEFWAIRAALPGFLGTIEVDAGAGRSLALSLWASAAQQQAAAPTLAPAVERLLAPLMAAPQSVLGLGAVVYDSLTTRA